MRAAFALHVVPGTLNIDDLKKRDALKTEAGRVIKVDVSQESQVKFSVWRLFRDPRNVSAPCSIQFD